MRKFFLIPLMTLFTCVMAWGATISVGEGGTYPATDAGLNQAIAAASAGDVIELTSDIAYATNGTGLINITKSITLDGQGHKIVGWGTCNSNHDGVGHEYYILTPLAINHGESASNLDVTIQNLTMSTVSNTAKKHEIGLTVFDNVTKITINNCDIRSHTISGAANSYGIGFYGETEDALTLKIDGNSFISAGKDGYGLSILRKVNADVKNSTFEGFSAVTFYAACVDMWPTYKTAKAFGVNNSGARGSVFYAKNCNFEAPNVHNGTSNAYGSIVVEDAGIDVTLDNCGINAEQIGNQLQACVMVSPKIPISHRTSDVNVTFTGDNSHINGKMIYVAWHDAQLDYHPADFPSNEKYVYWNENGISMYNADHSDRAFVGQNTGTVNIIVSGGTYAQNVGTAQFPIHLDPNAEGYSTTFADVDNPDDWDRFILKDVTIPAGYTVQEIQQDNKTLYRVVADIQTSYNINQDVPEEAGGAGENPNTNFIVQETTTLDNNATEANYVHVKDNGGVQTTLTVGKADADQTLTITNGMDVQDNAQVIIKSGSALVVENGGIISAQPSNIVIEANENGAASLLLSPAVTVNQTPNLTVKMTAKQIGRDSRNDYYWHRFAMPVQHIDTWTKEGALAPAVTYPTHLYGWSYDNNDWIKLAGGVSDMLPFKGYTLTLASEEISGHENELLDVTYVFKGKLAGNTNNALQFSHEGYNFFGNSYTGYISIAKLVEQITNNSKIQGTVWVWVGQRYEDISLNILAENPGFYDDELKEIAPMHTFVLKQNGTENANTTINYADAIWGNPRYGHGPAPAPRRRTNSENDAMMRVVVTAANGQKDAVRFVEGANYSDAFENGYDASKFMNAKSINVFATVNGEEFGTVATDNLSGKTITINTNSELAYTISFTNVNNEDYVLRDNVTGQVINIEEGATYEFAAQPNSVIEGRFEIIDRANAPTAIENTEVKANVKGIYTIMGQYLGENFDILPAGVYVVDGVKIVK